MNLIHHRLPVTIWIKKLFYNHLSGELFYLVKRIFKIFKRESPESMFGNQYVINHTVEKKRLLVLAPHPDDEILGLGGTLSFHLIKGSDVTIIYLTSGGYAAKPNSDATNLAKIRIAEANRLAKDFKFKHHFFDLDGLALSSDIKNNQHNVQKMVKHLNQLNPDEIYVPSFLDPHPDHLITNQILVAALKLSKFESCMILGYEIWGTIPFPNFFMDISDHFKNKMTMLNYHTSQLKLYNYERLCTTRNGMHYSLAALNSIHKKGFFEAFIKIPPDLYVEFVDEMFSMFDSQ